MKATADFDLCLFALQRSDLGKRAAVIREEAEALARRRNVTFQLPLILYEIDLLSAAMAFTGGEEFVESVPAPRTIHPQPVMNIIASGTRPPSPSQTPPQIWVQHHLAPDKHSCALCGRKLPHGLCYESKAPVAQIEITFSGEDKQVQFGPSSMLFTSFVPTSWWIVPCNPSNTRN